MLPLFGSGIGAGTFPAGTFPTGLGVAIGAGAVGVDVGISAIIEANLQTLLSSQIVKVLLFTLIIHLIYILVRRPSFFVVRHVSYD